ncbi:hypothetical protein EYR40_010189 [Pleurotus pulmonarius]|nr:hypothetical protein EYR40_010189 [Pleurotus pulmonarius]
MLARLAVRRVPRVTVASVRFSSSLKEGSVAQSREFSKKEKAHEDQYIRQHEQQLLQKLRDSIEAKKAELAALEKEHQEELAKAKSGIIEGAMAYKIRTTFPTKCLPIKRNLVVFEPHSRIVAFVIGAGPNIGKPVTAFVKEKEGYFLVKIDAAGEVRVMAACPDHLTISNISSLPVLTHTRANTTSHLH